MGNLAVPFNIEILALTPDVVRNIKPVTSLEFFDASGRNFHEDGLFSTSIFGRRGEEIRDYRFSYIDIKADIFHPILFKSLLQLKSLYGEIMAGREFAYWDEDKKDFEKSTPLEGQTGYHFFMKYWDKIEFKQTESDMRDQYIKLIEKFASIATTRYIVVMPAGLRDLEFTDNNRIEENEINSLYRKLLSISNVISETAIKSNPEVINSARWSLQTTFNEIFDLIKRIIEGKKKMILGKWASRRIFNGTRNVITSMDTSVAVLGQKNAPNFNSTMVGLYQALKSILPVARYMIRTGFISSVFVSKDMPIRVVSKKTLKSVELSIKIDLFDRWTSDDGIDKIIEGFREEYLRHKPIEIQGHYLGLIYKGPDNTFKIIQDIDDVPDDRDKAHVYPLTYCELLYLSVYKKINTYPCYVTRYPVTGMGSIYPSFIYVRTTNTAEVRRELDDSWNPYPDDTYLAVEFPLTGAGFINSLIPHASRVGKLGADFDGDTCSLNAVYSDDSVREVTEYFNKRRAYVGTNGKLIHSVGIDTVAFVLHNLTGD